MRKTLFLILSSVLVLLSSCATYTIAEARDVIAYPEKGTTETRLRVMEENRRKEEQKAEEERQKTAVSVYPENEDDITYPFYYNPVKEDEYTLQKSMTSFRTILIPLGEEELSGDTLLSIKAVLECHDFSLIALTGSYENQKALTLLMGRDAVTAEGGTVILSGVRIEEMTGDHIITGLTEEKSITLYSEDLHPSVPDTSSIEDTLSLVDSLEKVYAEPLIEKVSTGDGAEILYLTSIAPSSLDWTEWTEYSYREERSFLISDILLSIGWQDAFSLMRFSEETESGITRKWNGYEERLDFIYFKNMIATACYTLRIEDFGNTAVVAEFLIP